MNHAVLKVHGSKTRLPSSSFWAQVHCFHSDRKSASNFCKAPKTNQNIETSLFTWETLTFKMPLCPFANWSHSLLTCLNSTSKTLQSPVRALKRPKVTSAVFRSEWSRKENKEDEEECSGEEKEEGKIYYVNIKVKCIVCIWKVGLWVYHSGFQHPDTMMRYWVSEWKYKTRPHHDT